MILDQPRVYANSYTPIASRYVNLFEFSDFRKYLEAYQAARQASDKSFTRSQFCREIGLPNTRSYFNDLIKGARNISSNYVERFIHTLEMTSAEAEYFRILVYFNQSSYEEEVKSLLGEEMSLARWKETAIFDYLTKRLYPETLRSFSAQNATPLQQTGT